MRSSFNSQNAIALREIAPVVKLRYLSEGPDAVDNTIAMGESAMEIPKRLWIAIVALDACARLASVEFHSDESHNRSGMGPVAAAALASSLSFFAITNFMAWATRLRMTVSRT